MIALIERTQRLRGRFHGQLHALTVRVVDAVIEIAKPHDNVRIVDTPAMPKVKGGVDCVEILQSMSLPQTTQQISLRLGVHAIIASLPLRFAMNLVSFFYMMLSSSHVRTNENDAAIE